MGLFDNLLGKKDSHDGWEPTHRGLLKEVTYDEIVETLGRPSKAHQGRYVFWRGPLSSLDPDHDEGEYFEVSNKDFRGFGSPAKKASVDRENWFVLATSSRAIRTLADEVGGLARNIEAV